MSPETEQRRAGSRGNVDQNGRRAGALFNPKPSAQGKSARETGADIVQSCVGPLEPSLKGNEWIPAGLLTKIGGDEDTVQSQALYSRQIIEGSGKQALFTRI